MSWGTFTHNINLIGNPVCRTYQCGSLDNFFTGQEWGNLTWPTLPSDAADAGFPIDTGTYLLNGSSTTFGGAFSTNAETTANFCDADAEYTASSPISGAFGNFSLVGGGTGTPGNDKYHFGAIMRSASNTNPGSILPSGEIFTVVPTFRFSTSGQTINEGITVSLSIEIDGANDQWRFYTFTRPEGSELVTSTGAVRTNGPWIAGIPTASGLEKWCAVTCDVTLPDHGFYFGAGGWTAFIELNQAITVHWYNPDTQLVEEYSFSLSYNCHFWNSVTTLVSSSIEDNANDMRLLIGSGNVALVQTKDTPINGENLLLAWRRNQTGYEKPDICFPCGSLGRIYGTDWTTFQSDSGAFPNPAGFTISPSSFQSLILDNPAMPIGMQAPVGICSPDASRRYVRQLDRVGLDTTFIKKAPETAGPETIVALIGPRDLSRAGDTIGSAMNTAFRFSLMFQNPNTSWSAANVNVFMYVEDTNSDGTFDTLRFQVVYNNAGSYYVEKPDAITRDNSLTAAEFAVIWPSIPFTGTNPTSSGSSPGTTVDFSMDTAFPDSNYLWVPISINCEASGVFAQSLAGNPFFSDRTSYWFHPVVTIKVGDVTQVVEMPGDMLVTDSGATYATGPFPTTPQGGLSSNLYFWADGGAATNAVAIGGIGEDITDFEEFKRIVQLNRS